MIDILRTAVSDKEPLTLFGLSGKKLGIGYPIENPKEFFAVKAIGARAERLKEKATDLLLTPATDREIIQQGSSGYRNYKEEAGVQSNCKLLGVMTRETQIKEIDEHSMLWQLNWVQVAWPEDEGSDLCTKDGRLFFQTYVHDTAGLGPHLRMNEESALVLAQVKSKEEFLAQHAAGKQSFPAMATVKILRESTKRNEVPSGGSHSTREDTKYINFTIVEAADQPLGEGPTSAVLELVPFMPYVEHDSACILPSALHMVTASMQYAFQVRVPRADKKNPLVLPCQKIVALVDVPCK